MREKKITVTRKREDGLLWKDAESEELYCFLNFPVHMGVTDEPEEEDLYADLRFMIDRRTGILFVRELVSEDILYREAHYNNIGKGWEEHHRAFAKFMMERRFKNVFEVGGGTGLLSEFCYDFGYQGSWLILDPVPNQIVGCRAKYVKGFFDEAYRIPYGMDAVVHTHTLEHFYSPQGALDAMASAMPKGSWMFLSVPNMEEMYKRYFTNVLNFEHTFYCAEPYITYMLSKSGYEVEECRKFKDDHSVFYAARKTDTICEEMDFEGCYEKNKKLFAAWLDFHESLIRDVNERLAHLEKRQTAYLFGAHVYSQFLLGFGLSAEKLMGGVLDNDPAKQGKRLHGTSLMVHEADRIKESENPVVVLHAGTHNREIQQQLMEINPNVEFI